MSSPSCKRRVEILCLLVHYEQSIEPQLEKYCIRTMQATLKECSNQLKKASVELSLYVTHKRLKIVKSVLEKALAERILLG